MQHNQMAALTAKPVDAESNRQLPAALTHLLIKTEVMLDCARKGDWIAVDELDRSRKIELSNFFENARVSDTAMLSQTISTLLRMNRQIEQLAQQAKIDTTREQQTLAKGKQAIGSYLQHADRV